MSIERNSHLYSDKESMQYTSLKKFQPFFYDKK